MPKIKKYPKQKTLNISNLEISTKEAKNNEVLV